MRPNVPDSTYAVLGLLDKQPASGYDLAALADRALGTFWPISRTLVYRELTRLEGLDWVAAHEVAQDRFPDKRVWSTTARGRHALAEWLITPAEAGSGLRNGVLLKFMFGARMPPASLASLLADYRESLQITATDLATLVERLQSSPGANMGRLAALHGLRTAQARLGWLDEVEAELSLPPQAIPRYAPEPRRSKARSDRGPVVRSGGSHG